MNKPTPINPNTKAEKQHSLFKEAKSYWKLIVGFAGVVLVSALLYLLGSKEGWGIEATFTPPPKEISPWDCLHFSIVTFATLGYGDFRPVGFGRVIAGVEVTSGMILMGIFIARLVSRQQERMTQRIVLSVANNEIQRFRRSIGDLLNDFAALKAKIGNARAADREEFGALMASAASLSKSVARYWRHEARHPDLNDFVPKRSAARLLGDFSELMATVQGLVDSENKVTIGEPNRIHIRNISEAALTVADLLETRIGGQSLEHLAQNAYSQILSLRDQFALVELT